MLQKKNVALNVALVVVSNGNVKNSSRSFKKTMGERPWELIVQQGVLQLVPTLSFVDLLEKSFSLAKSL